MPTYEYKCDACGTKFERFQPMSAAPIKKCPKCGKSKVRRLISGGAGLIFKGSGFYITDYRDKSYGDSAKADSGDKAGDKGGEKGGDKKESSDSKADAKSDSKNETKSEAKTETKSETKSGEKKADSGESKSESKPTKSDSKPKKK